MQLTKIIQVIERIVKGKYTVMSGSYCLKHVPQNTVILKTIFGIIFNIFKNYMEGNPFPFNSMNELQDSLN